MRALVLEKGRLGLREIPFPGRSKEEAVIKVLKAGICSTDLELVKGYMSFEGVLGHEFTGQVIQAPERHWMGQRVVGEINLPCGKCAYCRSGMGNHCPSREVLGIIQKDGAFAEYLSLPLKNLHLLPEGVSDEEGVFVEPLAAALEIFDQIKIGKRDSVLVLGDGKLGLLIAQAMRMKTDDICSVGKHEGKLEILRKRGIRTFLKGEKIDQRFDVVVEATGNPKGLKQALGMVRPKGKMILKSTLQGEAEVDISKIVVDEIQLIGSRCGPFPEAIDVLKRKQVEVKEMIDGDFPLAGSKEAFALARKPGAMKVLITP